MKREAPLILALAAVFSCACGEASTSGPPSKTPTAGSGAPRAGSAGASAGAAGAATPGVPFVYVGSTDGNVSIYELDAAAGKLTLHKRVNAGNYPSFVALDPAHEYLYAVNESEAKVAAFSINQQTGELTFLNRVDSGGGAPAFVSVDRSGKYVLVANYNGGTARVFPIGADGSLGAFTASVSPGMNSHMIAIDPANEFAFVPNKGSDIISQYAFDASTGKLTASSVPPVKTATGAGPRHLAFHPNGKFAYVINELDDTLAAYSYDAARGQLTFLHALSTLPAGVNGASNSCAEVVVAPSGNFVYGSNRGHDSIATFSIGTDGKLTFVGTTPSGGNVPRSFALSGDGKLMLVANESGNVTSFRVDPVSGALTKLLGNAVPQKPQFVGIFHLPGQ